MSRTHIAIISRDIARELLAGRKSIESRFYQTMRDPIGRIGRGETLFFKIAGGAIFARARIERVVQLRGLDRATMQSLRRQLNFRIRASDEYWRAHCGARFGVLVWFGVLDPRPARRPHAARQFGNGWIVLERRQHRAAATHATLGRRS